MSDSLSIRVSGLQETSEMLKLTKRAGTVKVRFQSPQYANRYSSTFGALSESAKPLLLSRLDPPPPPAAVAIARDERVRS